AVLLAMSECCHGQSVDPFLLWGEPFFFYPLEVRSTLDASYQLFDRRNNRIGLSAVLRRSDRRFRFTRGSGLLNELFQISNELIPFTPHVEVHLLTSRAFFRGQRYYRPPTLGRGAGVPNEGIG